MKREDLDFVLVPIGLVALLSYHVWLLYQIRYQSDKTVIGINAQNRIMWVQTIMEDPIKNGILAVQTLRNNIMASTLLASMAIMLSSFIVVLMASNNNSSSSTSNTNNYRPLRGQNIVFGNKNDVTLSIKFFAILICFLLAFLFNVQSVRYYSHAGVLITIPKSKTHRQFGPAYVARGVNKGSYFWSLGLHVLYVSIPLFVWIFGPIPMCVCSILLVVLLYYLDIYHGDDETGEEVNGRGNTEAERISV